MNTALMRTVQLILTNKSGGAVAKGDVVVIDTTTASAFTTTTTSAYVAEQIGVVLEPNGIANNASGMIATHGYVPVINLSGAASLGDYVKTHTVAKQGVRHATPSVVGDFAQVLNTGTTPPAFLFGFTNQGTGAAGSSIGTGTVASLPSPGVSGDAYLPSDGLQLYRSTGAAQAPWGPIYPFVAPDNAAFAWRNQGGASVDTTYGGIYLLGTSGATDNLRVREIAIPTPPYTITAAFIPAFMSASGMFGLCLVDSVSGKLEILADQDGFQGVSRYTNVTTWSAFVGSTGAINMIGIRWHRINDDNAGNRTWSYSRDGRHWFTLYATTNVDYLTPDKVGFYVNSLDAGWGAGVDLLSWQQT